MNKDDNKKVYVTKTFLPPIDEYKKYLEEIWQSNQLTNQGPLLQTFEKELVQYLDLDNIQFVTNGTLALQVAIQALGIKGEIITTPFSYVATTSSILWEGCTPVFVDIRSDNFNIDEEKIEAAITEKTEAIMPVHVFGVPCNIEKIDQIAKKHNLKVIYDAAHGFGVKYKGKSLLSYGDISVCSFHATKLFHTIEGGSISTTNIELHKKVALIKKFGHFRDDHYLLGLNAKASEFQAAMGLCNLVYVDQLIKSRKKLYNLYSSLLKTKPTNFSENADLEYNYSYFPVLLKSEEAVGALLSDLAKKDIYPRRYFYPSLNELPYLDKTKPCPISENISRRVVCLPLYDDLPGDKVKLIAEIVNRINT